MITMVDERTPPLPASPEDYDAAPMPSAERQRRHRARRKRGCFVVPLEVNCDLIEALIKRGDLDEADAHDLERLGEAVAMAARRSLGLT